MATVIVFHDRDNAARAGSRAGHSAHIRAHLPMIVASGGLVTDDASAYVGGFIVLRAGAPEAQTFVATDPFVEAGVYADPMISQCRLDPDRATDADPWSLSTVEEPFVVLFRGARAATAEARSRHEGFRRPYANRIVLRAILEDASGEETGEVCVLDTRERAVAEAFAAGDPDVASGSRRPELMSRWRRAYLYGRAFY